MHTSQNGSSEKCVKGQNLWICWLQWQPKCGTTPHSHRWTNGHTDWFLKWHSVLCVLCHSYRKKNTFMFCNYGHWVHLYMVGLFDCCNFVEIDCASFKLSNQLFLELKFFAFVCQPPDADAAFYFQWIPISLNLPVFGGLWWIKQKISTYLKMIMIGMLRSGGRSVGMLVMVFPSGRLPS